MADKDRLSKFADIFDSDTFGLLDIKEPSTQGRLDDDWKLIEGFQEIVQFYENNNRVPNIESDDIIEFTLASRLAGIKFDPRKVKILKPQDIHNLLAPGKTDVISLEDLLANDPLGLLESDDESESIFKMSHVKPSDRLRPDYIARRKRCADFDAYEEIFSQIHNDLESGRRKLIEFKEEDLVEGKYFVMRGVVFYLESNNATDKEFAYKDGIRIRRDGRTRCIFDNGTESAMLFRSLVKAMMVDGFGISESQENTQGAQKIESDDVQNGFIYVLRSLSRKPELRQMKDLYKIGYCSSDVTNRIKNAAKEPTYLMSDVEVILTARCYNLDVSYLESNIHNFFGESNVLFEIIDNQGKMHFPREWFIAPLNIIEDAIRLIINKEIDLYRYDPKIGMIVKNN